MQIANNETADNNTILDFFGQSDMTLAFSHVSITRLLRFFLGLLFAEDRRLDKIRYNRTSPCNRIRTFALGIPRCGIGDFNSDIADLTSKAQNLVESQNHPRIAKGRNTFFAKSLGKLSFRLFIVHRWNLLSQFPLQTGQ